MSKNVGVDRGETALGLSCPCSSNKKGAGPSAHSPTHSRQCLTAVHSNQVTRSVAIRTQAAANQALQPSHSHAHPAEDGSGAITTATPRRRMTAGSLARFSLKTSGTFSLLSHRSNQRLASSRAQPASARHVGAQSMRSFFAC